MDRVMAPWIYLYMYALVLLFWVVPLGTSKEQLSSRECENLGFTGLALCSDCNTLAEYVKDQGYISIYLYLSCQNLIFLFIYFFVLKSSCFLHELHRRLFCSIIFCSSC